MNERETRGAARSGIIATLDGVSVAAAIVACTVCLFRIPAATVAWLGVPALVYVVLRMAFSERRMISRVGVLVLKAGAYGVFLLAVVLLARSLG